MSEQIAVAPLLEAVERYFKLMYDGDVSRFDAVLSPTQAMVKVRVLIDPLQYLDHLSYHRIDGTWLITAKSFHVERKYEQAAA